jgi:hypothetical protein
MMTETERPDITETRETPERKDSGNTMLTIKIMIIASVLLGVLWILDAMVTR